MPLRSVLFTQLCKYNGEKTSIISIREFRQIAGRAGRKGFDERGFVYAQAPAHVIENERLKRKAAATGKKSSKLRFQKPPERGYAHWNEETFSQLTLQPCEPLRPRFQIDHGTIVGLLRSAEPAQDRLGYRR